MSITRDDVRALLHGSGNVYSRTGHKIGDIGQVYLDNQTHEPTWVTVRTGQFGPAESFAPLDGARVDGEDIHVAYDDCEVNGAPHVDPNGPVTPWEEGELYQHYGRSDTYVRRARPDGVEKDPRQCRAGHR